MRAYQPGRPAATDTGTLALTYPQLSVIRITKAVPPNGGEPDANPTASRVKAR